MIAPVVPSMMTGSPERTRPVTLRTPTTAGRLSPMQSSIFFLNVPATTNIYTSPTRRLLQRLRLRADLADVVAFERRPELHDPALDRRSVGLVQSRAVLLERTLGLVRELLGVVLRVRDLAQAARLV